MRNSNMICGARGPHRRSAMHRASPHTATFATLAFCGAPNTSRHEIPDVADSTMVEPASGDGVGPPASEELLWTPKNRAALHQLAASPLPPQTRIGRLAKPKRTSTPWSIGFITPTRRSKGGAPCREPKARSQIIRFWSNFWIEIFLVKSKARVPQIRCEEHCCW